MRPNHRPTALCLTAAALAACSPAPEAGPDRLELLFADGMTVVDLTHAISANAPYWPGPDESPFIHDTLRANTDGSPAMAAYAMPEHFGTHFDAPSHGGAGLPSVDDISASELFGPAVVVDVTERVATDTDYALSRADLEAWEAAHGPIPNRAIVLMRSGWPSRWNEDDAYYNQGDDGRLHFPGFAEDAARFLVTERDIAGIGVDTGSVDPGAADGFPVHGVVNGAGRFHLENLADLSALPESGAYLVVAPIKIEGGSGGQVRVFAVVP